MKAAAELLGAKARDDTPATHGYGGHNTFRGRPGMFGHNWQKRPPFTLGWADLMSADHQVKFAFCVRNGPAYGLKVKVEATQPAVKTFVEEQWERIWTQEADKLLRDQKYGYLALEAMYKYADGQYQFDRYLDRHPADTTPLTIKDKLVGVSFQNLQQAGKANRRDLFGPQALWLSYDAEHSSLFGTAILESAFGPWFEKTCPGGALRVRQLRMFKDAYIGDQIYYEEGGVFVTADGQAISFRDVAVEAAENRMTGGTFVFPKRIDASGKEFKILEYEGPTSVQGIAPIMEWVDALDRDIFDAMEIPREVIEASETGSGYSGRAVPNQKFLAGLNPKLANRIRQVKEQTLVPLVAANHGGDAADEFDVKLVPLEESMAEAAGPKEPPAPPGQGQQQQPGRPQQLWSGGGNGRGNGQQFSAGGDHNRIRGRLSQLLDGTDAVQFAQVHAPHNMTVAGKQFKGGEFIPGDVLAKATPAERKALQPAPGDGAAPSKFSGATVGAEVHAHAESVKHRIARAVGGIPEEQTADAGQKDKKPYDVKVPGKSGDHDIEVKSMTVGAKQQISVHDDALLRKVNHVRETHNTFHTIVVDNRDTYDGGANAANYSGHNVYYKRGSGRYSLSQMHKVKDGAELKRLIAMPDEELPEAARGSLPPPPPLSELMARAARASEARSARDKIRKARQKPLLQEQARAQRAKRKAGE